MKKPTDVAINIENRHATILPIRRLQIKTNIEIRALRSLANWKSLFAEEVTAQAKLFASQGATPETVTLDDYQRAAPIAAVTLLERIASDTIAHADRKAA